MQSPGREGGGSRMDGAAREVHTGPLRRSEPHAARCAGPNKSAANCERDCSLRTQGYHSSQESPRKHTHLCRGNQATAAGVPGPPPGPGRWRSCPRPILSPPCLLSPSCTLCSPYLGIRLSSPSLSSSGCCKGLFTDTRTQRAHVPCGRHGRGPVAPFTQEATSCSPAHWLAERRVLKGCVLGTLAGVTLTWTLLLEGKGFLVGT